MDLGGKWRATVWEEGLGRDPSDAGLDDSAWAELAVPGHWMSDPAFAGTDGPVMYRTRFDAAAAEPGRRCFLTFEGIFYQGDVWLDGEYLGDTEGYFAPQSFEVTSALARQNEHLLGVEVACSRPTDVRSKRNLTGVFQHWDCIDRAWNPGGIWAPVRLHETGPVRLRSLKVLCSDANPDSAALDLEADLDSEETLDATLHTVVRQEGGDGSVASHTRDQALAAGGNVVRWRVNVERPDLWWPHALGAQPLYQVQVSVALGGATSDRREVTTGLRQVRVRNFTATVNGERLFLKGANCGPTRRALAEATEADLAGDVTLARQAGLDLLRVHAHITRGELYDAADRQGMMIWQDLPLQWGYGQVRRQAVAQARQAVAHLGHHPSVILWCGHNEPIAVEAAPGQAPTARATARAVAGQVLPSWNKTGLDRSIRRALDRADGSRTVVAHSGILPHPAWGTDTHFYFGWYHGSERDFPLALARWPAMARFVSEFGAQAVPPSAGFMHPERWPDLDWSTLGSSFCLQQAAFERYAPPAASATFDEWRDATQEYQASLLRFHIETLRRLKYRPTGGFCFFLLADAQPAVTWSVLDHERRPKAGYHAVVAACAPVIVCCDRPPESYPPGARVSLDVHAVSDLRSPLDAAVARAVLTWPGGQRSWRFTGTVPADGCIRIGRIAHVLPEGTPDGDLSVALSLRWNGGQAINSYRSRVEVG